MPDKYTKFLMHGNSDRSGFTLTDKTVITPEQKIIGLYSAKLASSDQSYLMWSDSDDWYLGTDNWTIEGWYRFSATGNHAMWGQVLSDDSRYQLHVKGGDINFYVRTGSTTVDYKHTWSYSIDTWYHLAVIRNGTSLLLFIDGDLKTWTSITYPITTKSIGNVSAPFRIGYTRASGGSLWMNGFVDGFRFSKGVVRWTSNFTPETERYDSDQYTKLLFYADDIADVSGLGHSLESPAKDLYYNTGKFNNCPYFDGGNYLKTNPHSDWNIGSQDFTIEFWAKFTSVDTNDLIGYRGDGNNNVWRFYIGGTGTIKFQSIHNGSIEINITTTYTGGLSNNIWYHMVLVREGSEFRVYIDGTKIGFGTDSSALHYYDGVGTLNVGMVDSTYYMNGYIDEVKFSVGIARYNNNFTPPTRPEDDFKIEGNLSAPAKIYLIDESNSVLERVGTFNTGPYDFVYVSSGKKYIAARADADGEGKAVGDITPTTLSGSEIFVERFTGTNGTAPNATYWTSSIVNTGSTSIQTNKLRQYSANAAAINTTEYKTFLSGNFDIEVDYSIVSSGGSNWWDLFLMAEVVSTGIQFRISRLYTTSHVYRSFVGTWASGNSATASTSDTSGKLKISRFGNTVHMYYWDGSDWASPRNNTEVASGQMKIALVTATEGSCNLSLIHI